MTDESVRTDSQAPQDQAGGVSAITVPATLSRESLPLPPKTEPQERDQPITPMGAMGGADVGARTQFVGSVHEYIRDNIRLADQKATFFFTGATALLAFLYRNDVSSRWLKPPMQWNLLDMAAFIAMVALAVGAFLSLVVIIPRTPGSRRGFIFWEAIAEYDSGRDYADQLSGLSPATLFQIKAEHSYVLAGICRRKYKWLRLALWVGAVGLGAALFVFLFLTAPTARQPVAGPTQSPPPAATRP